MYHATCSPEYTCPKPVLANVQVVQPDLFQRSRHYVAPRIQALQTCVLSASRAAVTFSCQLASARLAFLRQHAVGGSAVLPAAALAEMATAAVKLVHEDSGSGSSSIAAAALAVSAMPRLAACDMLNTTISQDSSTQIVTTNNETVATAHAAMAVHLDSQAAATATDTNKKQTAAQCPLARIVRTSPLLADAVSPSRPLAALCLSPGAGDGFWVHPGLLSAALVLTDTIEQPAAGSAQLLLAVGCWSAGDANTAAATQTNGWATAGEARCADIHTSQQHASLQVDLHHNPCLMSLRACNRQHESASACAHLSCDMTIICTLPHKQGLRADHYRAWSAGGCMWWRRRCSATSLPRMRTWCTPWTGRPRMRSLHPPRRSCR